MSKAAKLAEIGFSLNHTKGWFRNTVDDDRIEMSWDHKQHQHQLPHHIQPVRQDPLYDEYDYFDMAVVVAIKKSLVLLGDKERLSLETLQNSVEDYVSNKIRWQ